MQEKEDARGGGEGKKGRSFRTRKWIKTPKERVCRRVKGPGLNPKELYYSEFG